MKFFSKAYRLFTIAALVIAISSCEDLIDVQPIDEAPFDELQATPQNVQQVLNGAYQAHQRYGIYVRAGVYYGDDFNLQNQAVTNTIAAEFFNHNFALLNGLGGDIWNTAYSVIGRSNIVIDAVDKNKFQAAQAEKDRLKGEALFLRGFHHFMLVNYFSLPYQAGEGNPGVIVRTRFLTPEEARQSVPRNTVGETYAQVIADLEAAKALLPEANNTNPTKFTCDAALAKVYFMMGNYEKAAEHSNNVLEIGGYSYGDTVRSNANNVIRRSFTWNVNTHRRNLGFIFQAINITGSDQSGDLTGNFYNPNLTDINFRIDAELAARLSVGDNRRWRLLYGQSPTEGFFFTRKYELSPVNINIFRVAEMIYTRAESRVRTGNFSAQDIVNDLNSMRFFNGLDSLQGDPATFTPDFLLATIQDDRRLEFVGEPDRWFEVRRLNIPVRGVLPTDRRSLLKIPLGEVNANRFLEQN